MGDKVSDIGEKPKLGGICVRRAVLDLKRFGFGHDRKQSESEVNRKFTLSKRRYTYRLCIDQNDSTIPPNRIQYRELAFDYQRRLL